jgi:4-hydroxy-3-polyprenylbenzoate decarboxylase
MSALASSYGENLLLRAGDVSLKERRKLVLLVREAPLHAGHLEAMLKLARLGAVIFPPVPAFYHLPATVDALVDHTVGRVLTLLGVPSTLARVWGGA